MAKPRSELTLTTPIKCIALDLDRTTLSSDGHVAKETREAILSAIAKGIHVVVASGRSFYSLPKEVLEIPGIEYAITSNGASIYHVPSEKKIHGFYLSKEAASKILAISTTPAITYEGFIDGVPYANQAYVEDPVSFGATPHAISYIQSTRKKVADIHAFLSQHSSELDCIDIITKSEKQKEELSQLIKQTIPDVYVTSSVKQLLELSNINAGKHSGMKYIANLLGLERAQLAAFGDADNDVDLLSYVGIGFAMENGTEACKLAADYITDSNDCLGVAKAIWQMIS